MILLKYLRELSEYFVFLELTCLPGGRKLKLKSLLNHKRKNQNDPLPEIQLINLHSTGF